ncbi:MAG: tetratricopeptide repeat protein [Candidatus Margulisbacteria bacterium]|jgi:soluble lytic murein transglycosylase|nr:tetratricopeptide repeat protein [Candidatus Margulisiibacteriota bacterium]
MRSFSVVILLLALSLPLYAQSLEGGRLEAGALLLRAYEARQAGDGSLALDGFRRAAAAHGYPLADYAQFELGETHYFAGEYAAAAVEYRRVEADHPDSLLLARARLLIGKCNFNRKDFGAARKELAGLVDKYPDAPEAAEARYLIARAHEEQKDWRSAYLAYEEVDLFHPLSYFGKRSRQAIAVLKRAHKKTLPRFTATAPVLYKKGMSYFEQGDYAMAANIFNLLAREYPHSKYSWEALLMLGRAEEQTNKPSALADLERATRGPANLAGKAHYYLGLARGRRGDYDNAIHSLLKVTEKYPDSGLADEAAYWIGYYYEMKENTAKALTAYYNVITKYPYSKSVPAAIWRLGRTYYWSGDFKNAATYLHLAQLYPPGEDTPRCYFFEAKAQERLGNQGAAVEVYKKLLSRFDHTYYAYRAQAQLNARGVPCSLGPAFNGEDFSSALDQADGEKTEELAAVMEIWEQTKIDEVDPASSREAFAHLAKYKELMNIGLPRYAADEARYLVDITSEIEKDSAQIKLGEMLVRSGEYRRPIRFADRKIKAAVLNGRAEVIPKKIWELGYPRGYWPHVASAADQFKVDPYLVLAVIREESRFHSQAVSRSKARGLMQIMAKTGRGIAKKLELTGYRTTKLYEPSVNIKMGTWYLADLVKRFRANAYLALAGYNGGPNRISRYVKNWYNGDLKNVDIDEFIESIPVRETRLYVQKVMGSYFEYKRLYERKS